MRSRSCAASLATKTMNREAQMANIANIFHVNVQNLIYLPINIHILSDVQSIISERQHLRFNLGSIRVSPLCVCSDDGFYTRSPPTSLTNLRIGLAAFQLQLETQRDSKDQTLLDFICRIGRTESQYA